MNALKVKWMAFVMLALAIAVAPTSFGQTAATGALTGTVVDALGAVVPRAQVQVTNDATGEKRTVVSQPNGSYVVSLLPPGVYSVSITKDGFRESLTTGVRVVVAESVNLNSRLEVGATSEKITVNATAEQLQTTSSALGRVTDEKVISSLPLVTRNYTQILPLFTGVSAEVTNAAQLGRGGMGTLDGPMVVHGGNVSDNNFQMNGVEINDLQGSGSGTSGGIAIPNPDAIQEFKVQTGQYSAAFGRNAGANVDVITKGGTNGWHGDLFEFFRNEVLNANDFFLNRTKQKRPPLRQNQFGFTFGGPIKKDKLLFFTSYQGTTQLNGSGGAGRAFSCSAAFSTPPFGNDRSAAALGTLFAGLAGTFGGTKIAADGSNINPVALKVLQMKLPNGQFVIPTPQTVDPSQPFATQGFSAIAIPCTFSERQFITNADYLQNSRSRFSGRFFYADSDQLASFPGANLGGTTLPGFSQPTIQGYRNFSLTHTFTFGPNLVNEAEVAYHRIRNAQQQNEVFSFSDIGVTVPFPADDIHPSMSIAGVTTGGNGIAATYTQNVFTFEDSLLYHTGKHSFHFGGGITRTQDNQSPYKFFSGLVFLSWPDFLLGMSGAQNGTGLFSNVIASVDAPGLFERAFRVWDVNAYAQDDYKITSRLTLNLGVRYEHLGDLAEALGRNSNFFVNLLNPNPPATGTLQGTVVAGNFSGGTIPAGVTQLGNDFNINGDGQNTFAPRLGFAWQLPHTNRVVVRGGYGVYYTRITGQPVIQELGNPPWGILRQVSGPANAAATLQNPFAPVSFTIPSFVPYSTTTRLSPIIFSPTLRPPVTQQYSLNTQTDLGHNMVLEIGYVGARGTKLMVQRDFNQALSASATNPIRGVTTNTVANIPLRVPFQGFSSTATMIQSAGEAWYNALEVSLKKQVSRGLQFLASYTFSRDLVTDTGITSRFNGGRSQGDQNNPATRYGPDSFIREHRLVVSFIYELPGPRNRDSILGRVLGGWSVTGVTVYQSGQRLTLTNTNSANVFGTSADLAEIASSCIGSQLATSGSIESRLNSYFNLSCLPSQPPIIGADGVGTDFGNLRPGAVRGPAQSNSDIAILKQIPLSEHWKLQFRTEMFNAFNHSQFSNPDANRSDSAFGKIQSLAVNPRIIQFALKLNF